VAQVQEENRERSSCFRISGRADGWRRLYFHFYFQLPGGSLTHLRLVSGDLFEFRHLHLFGVPVGFIDQDMTVKARSAVKTFSIGVGRLAQSAGGSAPTRQAWLTVIIASLARAYERIARGEAEEPPKDEAQSAAALDTWLDPAFRPLDASELPPRHTPGSGSCLWPWPLVTLAAIMARTFSPPFPFHKGGSGLRHTAVNTEHDAKLMTETTRFLSSVAWPRRAAVAPSAEAHNAQVGGYMLWREH